MSYDPGDTASEDDDAPFVLDSLHLAKDASLLHFFQSLEELIAHGQHEALLLSAIGASRDIDQRLLDEAKVPVYQKPLPDKAKRNSISGPSTSSPPHRCLHRRRRRRCPRPFHTDTRHAAGGADRTEEAGS